MTSTILIRLTIPEIHVEQTINIHQPQPQGRRLERPYSPVPRRGANLLKAIGDVRSFRDDKDAALGSYEAIRLFEQIGDRYIARGKAHYGSMLMDSDESERGAKPLGDAREVWAAIKYEYGVQWIDELLTEKEKTEDDE